MKRRCVKDTECVTMPPPREVRLERNDASWKFWEDECILECPSGYREQSVKYNETFPYKTCVPCEGNTRFLIERTFPQFVLLIARKMALLGFKPPNILRCSIDGVAILNSPQTYQCSIDCILIFTVIF